MSLISRSSRALFLSGAVVVLASLAACTNSGDVKPNSPAYKGGELGNGGFTFACADTAQACLQPTSGDAKAFPAGVARGTTFRVRYIPKPELKSSINIEIDDTSGSASANASAGNVGTLAAVGTKFLDKQSNGFLAKAAGTGTIVARDATGSLIEFTTIPIREAAKLLVYDAGTTSQSAPSVRSVSMKIGEQKSFRVVAQDATQQNLGGSFLTTWKSQDANVADVESQEGGVVNLVARKAGPTTLTVEGLTLSTSLSVEVTQ